MAFPSLYEQWTNNWNLSYYQTVAALAKTPEPLLTMEPIFAVEAGKKLVRTPIEIYFRAPGIDFPNPDVANKFSQQGFQAMATEACTIFLEGKGEQIFPTELQKRWRAEFQTFQKTRWGTILLTNSFGCH
ncbi:MAG: hypothetical protein N4J56_005047 [Chroococcidiopsis sp. SAG 2025]|uniref:hypothetical protein n=1 Tax=Chroococcidiopsis sp. SAG 2025 TaxID=171389 RepID=UPI0029370856|nr:hypothetical protein [Chroococcidiopsis sp. SAG 2025]MDV2995393.1 hypothetical protein [Chroococcidiopsis sp. SAG 2025]